MVSQMYPNSRFSLCAMVRSSYTVAAAQFDCMTGKQPTYLATWPGHLPSSRERHVRRSTPRSGGRSHRYRTTSTWPCNAACFKAWLSRADGSTPRSGGRSHRYRTISTWPFCAANKIASSSRADGSTPRSRGWPHRYRTTSTWPCAAASRMALLYSSDGSTPRSGGRSHRYRTTST